jgi:hypothetical protein
MSMNHRSLKTPSKITGNAVEAHGILVEEDIVMIKVARQLPYHNLAEAYRRVSAALPANSGYHSASRSGLFRHLIPLARQLRLKTNNQDFGMI